MYTFLISKWSVEITDKMVIYLSKTSEELAAILLSGYLANSAIKKATANGVAKMLKEWTKAIETSREKVQDSK